MKEIDGKKVKELMEKKKARAIAISSSNDFRKSHIKGCVNIPSSEKDFVKKVQQQFGTKNEDVVLCGSRQQQSELSKLSGELEKAGFKKVYGYAAGPSDWKTAGLGIQKQA